MSLDPVTTNLLADQFVYSVYAESPKLSEEHRASIKNHALTRLELVGELATKPATPANIVDLVEAVIQHTNHFGPNYIRKLKDDLLRRAESPATPETHRLAVLMGDIANLFYAPKPIGPEVTRLVLENQRPLLNVWDVLCTFPWVMK